MTSPAAKRRIVHGLSVLPLLLCVFGWIWSYVHTERICYRGSGRDWSAEIAVGELDLWSGASNHTGSGWRYDHLHPDWEIGELYTALPDWHFLGVHLFRAAHPYSPVVTAVLVVIPFWMLSVASALPPMLLWRRMRKRATARGFAIEGLNQ